MEGQPRVLITARIVPYPLRCFNNVLGLISACLKKPSLAEIQKWPLCLPKNPMKMWPPPKVKGGHLWEVMKTDVARNFETRKPAITMKIFF